MDSVPSANQKVLEYVNTQIGKRVKTGICFDLVAGALNYATPGWDKRLKKIGVFKKKYNYVYGKDIKKEELRSGDVICFDWTDATKKSKIKTSHVCIVYSIDKNGNVMVAEQNADGASISKTKVGVNKFDPTGDDVRINILNLKFYRPY